MAARRAAYMRILEARIKLGYRFTSTISWAGALGMARDTLAICCRRYLARQYDPEPADREIDVVPSPARSVVRT